MSAAVEHSAALTASSTTAAAPVPASCWRYRGLARNARECESACANVATRSTRTSGSPRSSQPNRTASSPIETPMRNEAAAPLRRVPLPAAGRRVPGLGLQRRQDGWRDVERVIGVDDPVGEHEVVPLLLGVALHDLHQCVLQL